jgi:peptide/nickel transport system permease protein
MTSALDQHQASAPVASLQRASKRERTLLGDALRRLARNPLAVIGAVIVAFMVMMAIFADQIAPYSPIEQNLLLYVQPPSAEHILGTDEVGRDVLSRIIHGARISLQVSLLSVAIGLVVGTLVGLVAGFYDGIVDTLMMRLTDVFLAFPLLLLAIGLVAALGPSENSAFLALGLVTWPYVARLARGQALSLKHYEFITAAHAIGASSFRIMLVHMLPNMLTPLIVYATTSIANIILAESTLAFLGLGAQPPTPSWGGMLSDTRSFLLSAPWLPTYPGVAIFLASLGFNLLGDGLRDALDVKQ